MKRFEDHAFKQVRDAILAIDDPVKSDIYALSFYFSNDDDPRRPMLAVGYNTNARRQLCTPAEDQPPFWLVASDADEAKWNYAFWLQMEGELCGIGETAEEDALREEWLKSLKLWYTDEEEGEDFDRCMKVGEEILRHFMDWCAVVARRLHAEGVITEKFGRSIPIIVHELEYYDRIVEVTRQANPPGVAEEFEQWVNSR